jgi:proline dehydrogenase
MKGLAQLKKGLRPLAQRLAVKASRSYLSGAEWSDALTAVQGLHALGYGATVGYWNKSSEDPRDVTSAYLSALEGLAQREGCRYLSIKGPAFGHEPTLYETILERSIDVKVGLHFDSLGQESTDSTFDLIERSIKVGQRVGCTLPGRWKRSLDDAGRAIDLGIPVRVVKGQWEDVESPISDVRAGFMAVIERLAGKAARVRVATHDAALATEAISRLKASKTACELELLHGLPARNVLLATSRFNVPVSVYVPFGPVWLPYALSSAVRKPRVLWQLFKDVMSGSYLHQLPNRRVIES